MKINSVNLNKLFGFTTGSSLLTSIDSRIIQTAELLLEDIDIQTADEICDKVFVSKSRMRYLFKKEMGVSISKFVRWSKLRAAGKDIMNGKNFSDALFSQGNKIYKND